MVDLNINGGSQTLNGIQTYDNINITNGGILYVTPYNGTGTTGTLTLNITEINVDNTSSIIGFKRGYRGGTTFGVPGMSCDTDAYGGELQGYGGGSGGTRSGAGGGGYGTAGGNGSGGGSGIGGSIQGTSDGPDIQMGNGGGAGGTFACESGNGPGEPGGGMLEINAQNINIHGTVNFDGGIGGYGGTYGYGGGGASGGGILFNAANIDISSATITANGGAGGGGARGSGGPGGGGRIKIFYSNSYNNSGSAITAGTVYVHANIPPVAFNTFPQGATIIIDDIEQVPKTNAQIYLPPGTFNYIFRLTCYEDITGQVTVTTESPTTVNGSFVKNTGDLSIVSEPTGANVYFGVVLQGQTPLSYTCYPEGVYNYYISFPGYQGFVGSIEAIRNILAEVDAVLVPVGPSGLGSIYITSNPQGATVFLDGTNTGQITPHTIIDIPTGSHTIRLEKTGYSTWISPPITVGDNQTSSVTANLTITYVTITGITIVEACTLGTPGTCPNIICAEPNCTHTTEDVVVTFTNSGDTAITITPKLVVNGNPEIVGTPISITASGGTNTVTFAGVVLNKGSNTVCADYS
jgi:hypothetical protein